jgi:hypothetical protein
MKNEKNEREDKIYNKNIIFFDPFAFSYPIILLGHLHTHPLNTTI